MKDRNKKNGYFELVFNLIFQIASILFITLRLIQYSIDGNPHIKFIDLHTSRKSFAEQFYCNRSSNKSTPIANKELDLAPRYDNLKRN